MVPVGVCDKGMLDCMELGLLVVVMLFLSTGACRIFVGFHIVKTELV